MRVAAGAGPPPESGGGVRRQTLVWRLAKAIQGAAGRLEARAAVWR